MSSAWLLKHVVLKPVILILANFTGHKRTEENLNLLQGASA